MAKFPGIIDQIRIKGTSSSEQLLATQALNYLNRRAFYGLGAEDVFADPSRSVVALPYNGSMARNVATVIDMATRAYAPAGVTKIVESLSGTSGGTAIITVDGKVSVFASAEGIMRTDCTIRGSNGKASTARITMSVQGGIDADALYLNPFRKDSAHHRPIGTGATYAGLTHAAMVSWNTKSTMVINVGMPYGTYIVKGNPSDPLQTIKGTGFGLPTQLRLPVGFDPGAVAGSDSVVSYFNPVDFTIHDLWRFEVKSDGYYAGIHRTYAGEQLGHPTSVGERLGVSASGVGLTFCLLRGAEINTAGTAIRHALQMVMPGSGVNSMLAKTTLLPAASIDGFCVSDPTNNCLGDIPYGGLFAIPPVSKGGPDLTTLSLSEPGLRLAQAFRDYGVYAVDTGGNVALRADQSVSSTIRTQLVSSDLPKLYGHMRFITNSAWTAGQTCVGGGTPLAVNSGYDV